MKILFIDQAAPKAYSGATLEQEALGGTEATVTRVARALAGRGHEVTVYQQVRKTPELDGEVLYTDSVINIRQPDAVICLRKPSSVLQATIGFPRARHYLWLHDWAGAELAEESIRLRWHRVTTVCVSKTHKVATELFLAERGAVGMRLEFIYNPVDDALYDLPPVPVDPHRLVFFSSPHKGLRHTLELFRELRQRDNQFVLYVSNPGYYAETPRQEEGLFVLGPLPHRESLDMVRGSLCVFYPNTVFPETFGLVFAEANAVGASVVAHDFGAAREVLRNTAMDCSDGKAVIERVMAWHKKRPIMWGKPAFRLSSIIKEWEYLLCE